MGSLNLQERVDVLEAIIVNISKFINFDLSKWEDLLSLKTSDGRVQVTSPLGQQKKRSSSSSQSFNNGNAKRGRRSSGMGGIARAGQNYDDELSPQKGNVKSDDSQDDCSREPATEIKIENELDVEVISNVDVDSMFTDDEDVHSDICEGDDTDGSEEQDWIVSMALSPSSPEVDEDPFIEIAIEDPLNVNVRRSSRLRIGSKSKTLRTSQSPTTTSSPKKTSTGSHASEKCFEFDKVIVPTEEFTKDRWPKIRMTKVKVEEEKLKQTNADIPTSTRSSKCKPKPKKGQNQNAKKTPTAKSSLKCPKCELACRSIKKLKEHFLARHQDEVLDSEHQWSCPYCSRKLKDRKGWNLHIAAFHVGKKDAVVGRPTICRLDCPKCDYICKNYVLFRQHVLTHDPETESYSCPYCPEKYEGMEPWTRHIRGTHSGQNKKHHLCYYCGYSAPRWETVRNHISNVHEDTRERYQCDQCPESFLLKQTLDLHVIAKHTEGGAEQLATKCPYCDLVLSRKVYLVKHINDIHKNIRKYPCTLCELTFKRKQHLTRHLGNHAKPNRKKKGTHKKPFIKKPRAQPDPLIFPLTTTKTDIGNGTGSPVATVVDVDQSQSQDDLSQIT